MTRYAAWLAVALAVLVIGGNDCKAQESVGLVAGIQSPAADSVPVHSLKPKDTFFGPDKEKHFFMSAFVESFGFAGMEWAGSSRSTALGTATAVTIAAGVGREIHDKMTKNLFSLGDLMWDGIGTGAALLMISHTQR